jgi:hypothetical protein
LWTDDASTTFAFALADDDLVDDGAKRAAGVSEGE